MEKEKTKTVAINAILEKTLDTELFIRYRNKLGFSLTSDYLYQWALISLNEGNSDKAVSFIISALDIDRKHSPTLHLLKSMIIGLSKDFYENDGAKYKQQYNDLDALKVSLKKKAISIKKKNEHLKLEITSIESSMKEGLFFMKYFKKLTRERELLVLKNKLIENQYKIDNYKKEILKIRKVQKNEDYSKILGTILEICVLPKKFAGIVKD